MQDRKNMFILLIGVMVLLAGCLSDDKSSTATNESPNIAEAELSYTQDGKEVEASFIAECLPRGLLTYWPFMSSGDIGLLNTLTGMSPTTRALC